MTRTIKVPIDAAGAAVTALVYEADQPRACLVLAHGAGAGQQSSFMVSFARAFATLGLDTVTFNFPYTERGRRLPDKGPVLESCYQAVIKTIRQEVTSAARSLFAGGKSMGGRIATQIAAADPQMPIKGLVLLGYPLHPPGRPADRRDGHLPAIKRPVLFVQGSRDTFGTPEELLPAAASMSPPPKLHIVDGGDHSFKIRKSGDQAEVYRSVHQAIVEWIDGVGVTV